MVLLMFEEPAAVQKHVLMAQLKLHYCAIKHALLFRKHGVFSEHPIAEQDGGGHAG